MKGFNSDGKALYSDGEPLTSSMDNVLAMRIGRAAWAAQHVLAGDHIDRGLTLRRLLEEEGFEIREKR